MRRNSLTDEEFSFEPVQAHLNLFEAAQVPEKRQYVVAVKPVPVHGKTQTCSKHVQKPCTIGSGRQQFVALFCPCL